MVGAASNGQTIKFLCSYGGKIMPRYPDGRLRYHGGETRVLSVSRSVSFAELSAKLVDMCGTPVSLKCQLPGEDLDALVSVTSDEDLANLIEEYDRAVPPQLSSLKIRAFLSAPKTTKSPTSPPSPAGKAPISPKSPLFAPSFVPRVVPARCPSSGGWRCVRSSSSRPPLHPIAGHC